MSNALGEFLRPEGFDGPSGLRALSREGSLALEAARFVRRARADRKDRRQRPYVGYHRPDPVEPVLLIPGFMAGDGTLAGMSAMLRHAGYRTYRSQTRVNFGCTRETADRLERRIEEIATRRERKVSLVGHSLGGMLSRGLAVRRPDLIHGIVAMGSPIMAPAAVHQALVWDAELLTRLTRVGFGGMMSEDCIAGECARLSFEETNQPLPDGVGFTAIYSKRDGIVDWKACVDPAAIPVEVTASHIGMAVDPVVFDEVRAALDAQRLSRASRDADQPAQADLHRAVNR